MARHSAAAQRTNAEKMAFMTAMYCAVTSGQPASTRMRGLGACRSPADAPAAAASAAAAGRWSLWMKHRARDSAPASAPRSRSGGPPVVAGAVDPHYRETRFLSSQNFTARSICCFCCFNLPNKCTCYIDHVSLAPACAGDISSEHFYSQRMSSTQAV